MSDKQKRPYYIPKEKRSQHDLLSTVSAIVKALGDVAPKIDGKCKVVKKKG